MFDFIVFSKSTLAKRVVMLTIMLLPTLQASNFIKKEIPKQLFSCETSKIFKNTYFVEHTRKTASVALLKINNEILGKITKALVVESFYSAFADLLVSWLMNLNMYLPPDVFIVLFYRN